MRKIGRYFCDGLPVVSKENSCLEYTVCEHPSLSYKLRARVRLLSTADSNIVNEGKLSSLLESRRAIEEIFFMEKNNNKYLIQIIDDHFSQLPINLSAISITPQKCMKLMAEIVCLLERLLSFGVSQREPLEHYLRV